MPPKVSGVVWGGVVVVVEIGNQTVKGLVTKGGSGWQWGKGTSRGMVGGAVFVKAVSHCVGDPHAGFVGGAVGVVRAPVVGVTVVDGGVRVPMNGGDPLPCVLWEITAVDGVGGRSGVCIGAARIRGAARRLVAGM